MPRRRDRPEALPADSEPRLVWVSLDWVQPSPENSLIYRPVSRDDPEFQKLVRSIQALGVQEPLVLTADGFIISGHRRYEACRDLGVESVQCRIVPIGRADPLFEKLVREFNRQRSKTFDEILREQVIDTDPESAYVALLKHRREQAAVKGEFLDLGERKKRDRISRRKRPMFEAIEKILDDLRDWWPLSDREVHYHLLNDPPLRNVDKPDTRYVNDRACYQDTCNLLTRARLQGLIPFDAIADPTRTVVTWGGHRDVGGFLDAQLDKFLTGYFRDLQQSQPNHIEIIGEKNTIESSIRAVAMRYCIPYTIGRGYCSLDPRRKMCERFQKSGKARLIILSLADFDPEGEDIPPSFAKSMRDDFGIKSVDLRKVCLTHEQVQERDLPKTFDIKTKSKRYKKFAAKYGDTAHELEAIEPEERSRLLTEAIESVIDRKALNRELAAEKRDAALIASLRKRVLPMIAAASETSGPGE
jgi:hypothetical protein